MNDNDMEPITRNARQSNLRRRLLLLLTAVAVLIAGLALLQDVAARSSSIEETTASSISAKNGNGVPEIDLNGPDPNHNFATTFTENKGPSSIVANNMTISDTDGTMLQSASVILTNRLDGNDEWLEINTENTNLSAEYDPNSGLLQIGPTDTISNYQKALSTIAYDNLSDSPVTTDRVVTFQIFDGTYHSDVVESTVFIEAVNDAPLLDNGVEMRLSDIEEDDINQFGNRVASFIDPVETGGDDPISDPDGNGLEGVAIVEVSFDNGIWQFSVDAGASWQDFGNISPGAATLLDPSARVRFIPEQDFHGSSNIIVRAWDQTSGKNGDTAFDVTVNGGSTPFSSAASTVNLDVTAVNDPPVLDLNSINPGTDLKSSYLVGSGPVPIIAPQATVDDVDNDELNSAIVTLTTRPDGADEFLKSDVISSRITATPYDPATGELRLSGTATLAEYGDILRGIVYNNISNNPNLADRVITFVGNDGLENSLVATSTLRMLLSNNAPLVDTTLSMNLDDIYEDDEDPVGNTVEEIIRSAGGDLIQDDEGSLRGFAVVNTESEDGAWQYSVDGGASWWAIGAVSEYSAVLLNTAARIRFLPDADASGFPREITIRAWDQTVGVNGSQEVDVSQNGGNSAFSVETAQVTVDIIAINDAPLLKMMNGITAVYTEDNGPVVVAGPSLAVSDVDNQSLSSAIVRIANHQSDEADVLVASPNGTGIAALYDAETGILSLTGDGTVAEYQAVLRTVSFENRSQDPSTLDRIVTFAVNDVLTRSNIVSSTVKLESVNDLPLVDLNGEDTPGSDVAVLFSESSWGWQAVPIAEDLKLKDLDDSTLISATITLVDRPDGRFEYLKANSDDTNIKVDPENGQLLLTGIDSLANYERVLRTVSYTNSQVRPLTVDRKARFTVWDHAGKSNIATSHIVVIPKLVTLPIIAKSKPSPVPESDEPNNNCQKAYPLKNNVPYEFLAEDRHDWYSFTLNSSANVTVDLTDYEAEEGQILVAEGECGALIRIGHNGDFSANKSISLDNLAPGAYYIWLITDHFSTGEPYKYKLQVKVQ